MNPITRESEETDLEMDSVLKQVGAAWTEDSCRDSEKFLASFESALRGASTASRQKVRGSFDWRRWWVPVLTSAACAVGLLVLLFDESQWAGTIVFQDGRVIVRSAGGEQGRLGEGSLISSGTEGKALLSLDGDRIKLFVNHETGVKVQTASSIRLDKGEIWVRVQPESGFFGIETPHGFVHVQGTTFGVTVTARETQVEIAAGKVAVGTGKNQSLSITPGTTATLSFDSSEPVLHDARGDITPVWAEELFSRAVASQALAYFPSAAPRPNQ